LWALLAPIFPDLEDEENFPSAGHKHPRVDLCLPSLRIIIEVKFLRTGRQKDCANLIEEVAADASLYRIPGSNYDQIIAFVWDDSGSTEQHRELEQGLTKIPGVISAVIISRPSKMKN
jgi:hypothetical protein